MVLDAELDSPFSCPFKFEWAEKTLSFPINLCLIGVIYFDTDLCGQRFAKQFPGISMQLMPQVYMDMKVHYTE